MRKTTVVENGKDIPYEEWITRKVKKLRIMLDLADTEKKRRDIKAEIREVKHINSFINPRKRSIENCKLSI